jgi:hypothetical protein
LSARAKALYSVGRFVAWDGSGAQFALPNAAHRDRCLERVSEVEAALTAHFKAPVRLVLVVEGDAQTPSTSGGSLPPLLAGRPDGAADDLEDENAQELEELEGLEVLAPEDHQASAVDRLLEAFPGASEVDE